MKGKSINEAQFLSLLEKVLPKATKDTHLANAIMSEMTREINLVKNIANFEKMCDSGAIPDLEPETVATLQNELAAQFGEENVVVTPDEEGKAVAVEIALPDRTISSQVKVDPDAAVEEVKVPFVAYPVTLVEDPELVWMLGRREDLGPDEAARALGKIQEEFWATKKGQQLQRDGVERSFAEFIINVPAAPLTESGLKRHYKAPEVLKTLQPSESNPAPALVEP